MAFLWPHGEAGMVIGTHFRLSNTKIYRLDAILFILTAIEAYLLFLLSLNVYRAICFLILILFTEHVHQ
jgi:hypothetical protein